MECKFKIEVNEPKSTDVLFKPYVNFRVTQLNMSSICMTDNEIDYQVDELIKQIEDLRVEVKDKLRLAQSNHSKIIEDKMKEIAFVRIVLDDNVPEYMSGVIRVGSIISEDEDGNEIMDHQKLIDNTEYHSNDELIEDIARKLEVDKSICEIVD